MLRVSIPMSSLCLVILVAGCGSSQNSTAQSELGGSGNGRSTSAGGSTGSSKGSTSASGGNGTSVSSTGTNQGAGGNATSPSSSGGTTGSDTSATGSTQSGGSNNGQTSSGNSPSTGGKSTSSKASSSNSPLGGSSATASNRGGAATAIGGQAAAGRDNGRGGNVATGGQIEGGGRASVGAAGSSPGTATGGSGGDPSTPLAITSADGAFWKTAALTEVSSGNADVTVSTSGTQSWTGFGGTFNEAGWDALNALSDADKALAIRLLFDAADGANFAYGRIPIGASDYGMSEYTLDDTANDTSMAQFKIDRDLEKLIPFINAAKAVKPDIHFWASPWTPPPWMKSNNGYQAAPGKTAPYAASDGYMKNDATTLTAFALYLEKFVEAYAGQQINIEAIFPQNEPGYGNPYPSCYWDSATFVTFIKTYLGPLFAEKLPKTEIWAGTMSAPGDGDIAVAVSNDSAAMKYVKGFGLQWNTTERVATLKSKGPVMMTEHKCGNYNFDVTNPSGDFSWKQSQYDANKPQNDYAYGIESWKFIRDWIKLGVNSYAAWNMVLDTSGVNLNKTTPWHQNALLVVNRSTKTLTKTPAYYVFRHASQFVGLPATVVSVTGGDALGFKNADSSYTVVLYNKDAAKSLTLSIGGKKLKFDMPANGWATVKYKP